MQSLTTTAGDSANDSSYNLNHPRVKAINRLTVSLKLVYPNNVTFIDHETILEWNVEISDNNGLPSATGYATPITKVA